MIDWLNTMDGWGFVLINQTLAAPWLDGFMDWVSNMYLWAPLYALFLFFIVRRFSKKAWLPLLFLIGCFAVSDSVSSRIVKPVFQRVRPCNVPELTPRTPFGKSSSYGFVSSHAANHFALAIFLILLFRPKGLIIFLLIFWAALISYSRVYLGKHYPGDVIGGAILGSMVALLLYVLMLKLWSRLWPASPLY